MRCTGDEKQFLLLRTRRLAITLLGHVERVGNASGNHQERLVDKVHPLAGIKSHQIHKAALGVAESGVWVCVALEIIAVAVTVEIEGQFGSLFRCHATHVAHVFRFRSLGFALTGDTGIGEALLHVVDLRIEETVAAHQSGVEHTERGDCLKRLSVCAAFSV